MTLFFSDTNCKPSWFILPGYGCYYIYQKRTTWLNAGLNCIQSNGSLVSWETRDEFFTMKTYLQNNFCELQGTIFFFYSITVGIHSAETPSMVDPQWNILYWGFKWNLHRVCWGAVGCEWETTSVHFGITYVCFISSRLPVFAVGPQYRHREFFLLLS